VRGLAEAERGQREESVEKGDVLLERADIHTAA